MTDVDPIELMFGGLDKLGPGSDADTARVLAMLPDPVTGEVVDAGCGTGRQTLVLARSLDTTIHALDTHRPFLDALEQRARDQGLDERIRTHCLDIARIPDRFSELGLLWSEGAAYTIGFPEALRSWRQSLRPGACAGVSELCWLRDDAPADARRFFAREYPAMRSLDDNLAIAREAGYRVVGTHHLPEHTWVDGYYDQLAPRARELASHAEPSVRAMAEETLEEVRVFGLAEGSYGYVFFLLQRP